MKVRFAERADKDYAALRPEIRKAFAKQLGFLLNQWAIRRYERRNTTRRTIFGRQE